VQHGVATLEALRASLEPDQVLLEYSSLGDELVCFEVSPGSARVHRGLAHLPAIRPVVEQLRFQMSFLAHSSAMPAASKGGLERAQLGLLRALYQTLLGPLDNRWRDRQLIVVPHGPLHAVPFHALCDGSHYVLEQAQTSYAASASLFLRMKDGERGSIERPLLVATEDALIPAVQREVERIGALFPQGRVLSGGKATLAALRKHASDADVLHLATHATFRSDNPWFSSFKLANSWLLLRDIPRLGLNAWLAVLSACDTGQVAVGPGDELVGLSHAFFQAGCRSLVASMWNVDDTSAALLMEDFYRRLRAGDGLSQALRAAQLDLRRDWPSPYYWAPFFALGRP
jgi:CHAT domain-containing protein